MEKLTLKDSAPYLAYGLKFELLDYLCDYVGEKYGVCNGFYFIGDGVYYTFKDRDTAGKNTNNCKPILRPLSDLIKEIEVDGKYIVPITELRCIEQGNWDEDIFIKDHTKIIEYGTRKVQYESDCYWIEWKDGLRQTQILSIKDNDFSRVWKEQMMGTYVNNQLMLFNKLFEWHFDVFGLIEKGLAIDINTIKK